MSLICSTAGFTLKFESALLWATFTHRQSEVERLCTVECAFAHGTLWVSAIVNCSSWCVLRGLTNKLFCFFQLSNQAVALQQKASDDPLNLSLSEEAGKSSDQLLEVIKSVPGVFMDSQSQYSVFACDDKCFVQRCVRFNFFSYNFLYTRFLSLSGNSGCLTWVRLQQPQEQRYMYVCVCVFS